MQHNQPPFIILGIDPGTITTGYGIIRISSHQIDAVDFGCIKPPIKASSAEKYLVIFNGIEELLNKFTPNAVAVEGQFVHKNAMSALKLGMARGMALLAAAKRNISIYEYAPRKAKLAVVGNGAASKYQVQKMIQLQLKLHTLPEPEDAADALALALCHAHTLKYEQKLCMNTSKGR